MINISNISKTFTTKTSTFQALKNVSLEVKKGLIHGVIGPSGAGKSTLIRTMNQLECYDNGSINVFEYKDIKKLNKESTRMFRKRIGMIFQNFNLLDRQTVFQNIAFPIKLDRKLNDEDINKVNSLIQTVGLTGYEDSYPSQLSGGQKQRVGIARALVNNPELLLCDEPTSALDTQTIKSILALLKDLKEKLNLTVVIVTHDMNVINEICDVVTVMDQGEIVEHNTIDNIIFNPQRQITKDLLDTVGFNLDDLLQKFKNYPYLTLLKFKDKSKQEAIISKMSREEDVDINILYANITPKDQGIMLVSFKADSKEKLTSIYHKLETLGVETRYVQ